MGDHDRQPALVAAAESDSVVTESGHKGRVVLASDKFKGSMAAQEVAEALADGMRNVLQQLEAVVLPVADGGD